MAAATVPAPPVVLRVKRKREEDPVEALMLTKHARIDPLSVDATAPSVFRFAGTVVSTAASEDLILEKVKGHSKLAKLNPLANLSLEDSLQQRREQQQAARSNHRYKVISKKRAIPDTSDTSDTYSQTDDQSRQGNLCILDLEEEENPPPPVGGAPESGITCNDVTMVREKSKDSTGSQFVYDLYYTQDLSTHGMATIDWSSVCIRECGVELVHDILDPDDPNYEDDDDDSNDECNWRNDYPDEEDLSPNSSHSNSDEDFNEEYRHRDVNYDVDSFDNDFGDFYR